jgi:hypothetical protein
MAMSSVGRFSAGAADVRLGVAGEDDGEENQRWECFGRHCFLCLLLCLCDVPCKPKFGTIYYMVHVLVRPRSLIVSDSWEIMI